MKAFCQRRSAGRVAITLALPGAALLLGGYGPGPLVPIGPLFGPGSEWFGGLLMLLLVAVVVVALDRRRCRRTAPPMHAPDDRVPAAAEVPSTSAPGPAAEIKDIVLKRYARGEIDRDAFVQMWTDLSR